MSWLLTFSRRGGGDVKCPGPNLILYDDPRQLTLVNFVLLGRRLVLFILPSVARLAYATRPPALASAGLHLQVDHLMVLALLVLDDLQTDLAIVRYGSHHVLVPLSCQPQSCC